ncbi:hypothetical protein NQ318_013657 [Aromia moschata]|uniref:Uncharacterized protein n=1 Tax=Aromia moschata TaxID=1265417 RepID=A0AAV8XZE1_9CUCU|nr:hypothetical protein NQ318_013657 [Aromia moschata]
MEEGTGGRHKETNHLKLEGKSERQKAMEKSGEQAMGQLGSCFSIICNLYLIFLQTALYGGPFEFMYYRGLSTVKLSCHLTWVCFDNRTQALDIQLKLLTRSWFIVDAVVGRSEACEPSFACC